MNQLNKKRRLIYFIVTFSTLSAGLPTALASVSLWGVGASSRSTLCDTTSATCSVAIEPYATNAGWDSITGVGQSTYINSSLGTAWTVATFTGSFTNYLLNRARLRGGVYASDTGVIQAGSRGLDGITYTGTESMTLTITGELSGEISNDIGSDLTYLAVAMAVLMPSEVNALSTTNLQPYFGSEITPLDFSSTSLLETGSTTLSVSLDLDPGDTFYLWSALDLSAAAGGSAATTQHFSYVFSDGFQFTSSAPHMLPVPGAVWMFGSAIFVLVAKSRRRLLPV